ncbi:MAG: hypothetical protein AB8F94_15370 [Saprospiraceae bacterium]
MSIRFIPIILCLIYSSCSNSQTLKIANYNLANNSSPYAKTIEAPILKANDLFKAYTNQNPKEINLFILDSINHLKHNPTTEEKNKPEVYLSFPPENLTKIDTLEILKNFKNKIDDQLGTTFVVLDSLGNTVNFFAGFQKLNIGENTTITSTTKLSNKQEKSKTVKFENLTEAQAIQLAIKNYHSINYPIDLDIQYKHFLWLNFFYKYFEVNQSTPPTINQEWLLNFSVIDAANLQLPDDFKMDKKKLAHLKVIFNKSRGYVLERKYDAIGRYNLFVPKKDDHYTNKWKYVILNLSNYFTSDNKTFNQMILTASFLKSKYGNDVIKDLTKWYLRNSPEKGPLLIISFLKEKYQAKTTINDLNEEYLNWVEEKM